MKSHTSLVAQQTRLSEWADMIRDCQNCPQGMKIDEWRQLHNVSKASYYWRLRKVRKAYLETADPTQTFVEIPSSAIQPVNMAAEHKIVAVIMLADISNVDAIYIVCGRLDMILRINNRSCTLEQLYRKIKKKEAVALTIY